jgi:uncharacterized protein YuzE
MPKPRLMYFPDKDILYLWFADGKERASIELRPNVTAEYDTKGALLGIEMLDASPFVHDLLLPLLDAAQASAAETG